MQIKVQKPQSIIYPAYVNHKVPLTSSIIKFYSNVIQLKFKYCLLQYGEDHWIEFQVTDN